MCAHARVGWALERESVCWSCGVLVCACMRACVRVSVACMRGCVCTCECCVRACVHRVECMLMYVCDFDCTVLKNTSINNSS